MVDLITVVIPVYNVEAFLRRCVDSVLGQSYSNLEIILVDDGSPDGSPQICDEYRKKDARIRVIHKKNGGLASARNAGMEVMTGKYLFFLDSDDWLEPDGLERLYRVAEEQQVDFVRYRAIRTGWPGQEENIPCCVEKVRELTEGLYDRERIIQEIYPRLLATSSLTMGAIVGAWGSLYRVAFLWKHHLRFYEEVKFSEDLIFSANVVRAANRFYFVDTPGTYHYFYNPNSISKSFRAGRWDSCKDTIRFCEKDFSQCEEYDFSTELQYLRWFCIMLSLNERKFLKTWKEKKEYCRKIIQSKEVKETKLCLKQMKISWKQKVMMVWIKLGWSGIIALH